MGLITSFATSETVAESEHSEDEAESGNIGFCGWVLVFTSWLLVLITLPFSLCVCFKVIMNIINNLNLFIKDCSRVRESGNISYWTYQARWLQGSRTSLHLALHWQTDCYWPENSGVWCGAAGGADQGLGDGVCGRGGLLQSQQCHGLIINN